VCGIVNAGRIGFKAADFGAHSLGAIVSKCEQRTSESNDNCEHDCSIPKHATPQARG
jgi:hypothetical protein